MKIEDLSRNEIDGMIYADLAYIILNENGEQKTDRLYKKITKLKKMTVEEYEDTIADFFAILSTDKRFIILDNGKWGLKDNHITTANVDLDIDEEIEAIQEEDAEEEQLEEIELFIDEDEDYEEDDLAELSIVTEDELREEE